MRRSCNLGSGKSNKDKQTAKQIDKKEPKKIVKSPWNNEVVDQSMYKLTPEEVYKRHLLHKSKNIEAAKLSLIKKSLNFNSNKAEQSWVESPVKILEPAASSVTVAPTFLNDIKQGLVVNLEQNVTPLREAQKPFIPDRTPSEICDQLDSLSLSNQIAQLKMELEKERAARLKVENEVTELRLLLSQVIKEVLQVRCTLDKDFLKKIPDPVTF